ncbi:MULTISPECIES: hypothetical protein [unclassified Rossellomorea]|uniref:hypothetical protein n=1 Tax=unclassified Rossellomorea TaxID=2837526 RepID=UPI00263409A7|nr:hypothetical protein [uncultured Rossellomorea sp.]
MKRPIGVSIISYFYIFGAIVLLFTAIFYQAAADTISISERFGVPIMPERFMRVVVAFFSLVMVYGYMRLKKWGFWLFIAYSVLFGVISFLLLSVQPDQPFIGNFIFSVIVLTYTIYVKEAFFRSTHEHRIN